MIAVSASKPSIADLNNLRRALEIDVAALTEILVPRDRQVEMGVIDVPAHLGRILGSAFGLSYLPTSLGGKE